MLEYPQSGEGIRGRHNIQACRVAQPNAKHFTVRRIVGARLLGHGFVLSYDGRPFYSVSVMKSWMERWPARPSILATRSSQDRRARIWSSERGETSAMAACSGVLDRAELPVATARLARFLIGKRLVRVLAEGMAGGIVKTEGYGIGDLAGHAYRSMTLRNRALFLERGHACVYLVYGTSFMLSVPSEMSGVGAGVLIRAIEPTDGITIMQRYRVTERVRDLARSSGRLSAALRIDCGLDGIDLCRAGPLWLGSDDPASSEIGWSKRIGITRAADSLPRFYVRGNSFVSGPQALNR